MRQAGSMRFVPVHLQGAQSRKSSVQEGLLHQTYAPEKGIIIREIDKGDYENLLVNMTRG